MTREIKTVLRPALTQAKAQVASKKKTLQHLAQLISSHYPHMPEDSIFDCLVAREKLGSTGIGFGIAIPHCRIEGCNSTLGSLITLEEPIDFESLDGGPVDIVFALLVPEDAEEAHLATLALIAEKLNDAALRDKIRTASSSEALFDLMASV